MIITWSGLWLTLALAQEAPVAADEAMESAARRCADAATGTEIDVCLQLAATSPGQVEEIAAALVAHTDRASGPDRMLLEALLMMQEPATAPDGAAQLGGLADRRAIPALLHAGRTRELETAVASARALGAYPEALGELGMWLSEADLPVDVRVAAANALGQMSSAEAADALVLATRGRGIEPDLRRAMVEVLGRDYPQRLAEVEGQVYRDGTPWMSAGGAVSLGYVMAMAGRENRAELAALGALSGAAAGGSLGWVAGRAYPIEAEDAAFITLTGTSAIAGGQLLGRAAAGEEAAWWAGLASGTAGFSLSAGLRKLHRGDVRDSVEATIVAGTSAWTAGATEQWLSGSGPRDSGPQLAAGLGLFGGLALGHVYAPAFEFTTDDALLLGITGGAGLLAGLSTEPSSRQLAATAGLGFGLLGGYALSPWFDAPPDVVFGAVSGGVILGASGLGIGTLFAPVDDQTGQREPTIVRTATFVGTAAGLGLGAHLGLRNPDIVDQGDVLFTGFVAGWMTWQAAGWNIYARRTRGPSRADGLYILVPALVTGAVGASTPYLDVPISYSLTAASTGLWGGYVAGSMAEVTRTSDTLDGRVLRAALHGSNLGIAAGTALTLPPFRGSPLVIGMANAGGVTGGASFALVASAVGATPREALGWSVLGSGLGFATGTAAGLVTHRKGGTREIAWRAPVRVPGTWSLAPATFEGDDGALIYGARLGVHGW